MKATSIYLLPATGKGKAALKSLYERAIGEARELFIVTAYLRKWNLSVKLRSTCSEFLLVAGTDFGITRKKALRAVYDWLPASRRHEFLVTEIGGFHPKAMLWTTKSGERYLLAGSSNLTAAGLGGNYEANVLIRPSESEYEGVREWIRRIESHPATCEMKLEWLKNYKEGKAPAGGSKAGGKGGQPPLTIVVAGTAKGMARRRAQQRQFVSDRGRWLALLNLCATRQIKDLDFYERMRILWAPSRFQAHGIEILGKNSRWHLTSAALLRVIRHGKSLGVADLDRLVVREMDHLARIGVSMRRAWFSEMLCHFFPDKYPVLDAPVSEWLGFRGFRAATGSSEGERYLQIAQLMRATVARGRGQVRNLAELDYRVWAWSDARRAGGA